MNTKFNEFVPHKFVKAVERERDKQRQRGGYREWKPHLRKKKKKIREERMTSIQTWIEDEVISEPDAPTDTTATEAVHEGRAATEDNRRGDRRKHRDKERKGQRCSGQRT